MLKNFNALKHLVEPHMGRAVSGLETPLFLASLQL